MCKLVDEIKKEPEDELDFCIRYGESSKQLFVRIQTFFNENVKEKYRDVFNGNEQISLNSDLIYLIVEE